MPLFAIPFPAFDPVLIEIGPFSLRWYALAYIVGIFLGWWYAKRLVGNQRLWGPAGSPMKPADIDDFVVWCTLGIILGGRIGYVLFYDLPRYAAHPLEAFALWQGGMSFHGGFLGTVLAMVLFSRVRRIPTWSLIDVIAPSVTFGLFLGRLANFVNGELWGRPTDVPWAMAFPDAPDGGTIPAIRASSTRRASKASRCSSCSASSPIATTSFRPPASSPAPSPPAMASPAPLSSSSASPTSRSAIWPAA